MVVCGAHGRVSGENIATAELDGSLLDPSFNSYWYLDVDKCSFLAFETIGKDLAVRVWNW